MSDARPKAAQRGEAERSRTARPKAAQRGEAERSRTDDIRAFIAVDLDDAARTAAADLLARLREGSGRGVRWVRPEALHVTLFFLGSIAPEQVGPIARSVASEVGALAPFRLELGEVHLFPSPRRPRVVAVEVAPESRLAELAGAVQRGVVAEGFEPEERPFRAHLTLGRIKTGQAPATRGLTANGASCEVGEVVLFQSELRREGAKYTPLERMSLGAEGKGTECPRSEAKPSEVEQS